MWESSQTRARTRVPCIGRQILNHCTTREAPSNPLMFSFAVQKILSFIRSHFLIFVFISITLGGGSKRSCCDLCHRVFCLCFPLSFIVSGLTFRSLIHFEFIFVYGVRECSNFILLHVAVHFSQHHLLKRLSFLHCIPLPPLS